MYTLFVLVGFFCLLASLMAFLITYNEYAQHYVEKQTPLRIALEAAIFTFCVFLVLSLIVGFFLNRAFVSQ